MRNCLDVMVAFSKIMEEAVMRVFIILIMMLNVGFAQSFKKKGSIPIDSVDRNLLTINDLILMENGNFLFVDTKAANFKIVSSQGKYIKSFGSKGVGPKEFLLQLFLTKYKNKFAIMDMFRRKFFIMQEGIKNNINIVGSGTITSVSGCLLLDENRILLGSDIQAPNGSYYSLYVKNIKTNEKTYLVKTHERYGFKSREEYLAAKKDKIAPITYQTYQAFYDSYIYYVWAGNLKIMRIKPEGGVITCFGEKTDNYISPIPSKKLIKLRLYNKKKWSEEVNKLTLIDTIFAFKKGIIVSYKYQLENSQLVRFFQFYSKDMKLKKEFKAPDGLNLPWLTCFLDNRDDTFYFFVKHITDDGEEESVIDKYRFE